MEWKWNVKTVDHWDQVIAIEWQVCNSTNDHLWYLKFCRALCPRTKKHLPLKKVEEVQVRVNKRRAERDHNSLFSKQQVLNIFVWLSAMTKQWASVLQFHYLNIWVFDYLSKDVFTQNNSLVNTLIYVYNTLLQHFYCMYIIEQYAVYLWGTLASQSSFKSSCTA